MSPRPVLSYTPGIDISGEYTELVGPSPSFADALHAAKLLSYDFDDLASVFSGAAPQGIHKHLSPSERNFLVTPIPYTDNIGATLAHVQSYFVLLDKAFFFSLLSRHVTLVVHAQDPTVDAFNNAWPEGAMATFNLSWRGIWSSTNAGLPSIQIAIQRPDNSQSMNIYISLLAHEMCHAFLGLYARGHRDGGHEYAGYFANVGVTGHGATWCDCAMAIQRALMALATFYGERSVNLWVERSLFIELSTTKLNPSMEQLTRWGFEYCDHISADQRLQDDEQKIRQANEERANLEAIAWRVLGEKATRKRRGKSAVSRPPQI